jgi:tetratricopeptide (TPR) repeat protein
MKNLPNFIFITFVFSLLMFVSITAQSVDELLKEGDQYAEEKWDNQKALDTYLSADKISPNNYEVYWRISRAYVDITEHMPTNTDDQKDAQLAKYQVAFDWAEKAVKLAPDKSVTYLRRAIANGRIALFKGIFSVIGIVNSVRDDLEKAIKFGNGGNIIQSVAHYVLARTHAKVCDKAYLIRLPLGLGWGDLEVAEKEYKKAIELRPNFRMFYLDLAKLYVEDDEYQKARECLAKVEQSPKEDEDDDKYLAEAKVLKEKIKNE